MMMVQEKLTKKSLKKMPSKHKRKEISEILVFQDCIKPAPLAIKPFSSLMNPFKNGCSIFCNHPTKNNALKLAIENTKRKRVDYEREASIMGQIIEDIICKCNAPSIDKDKILIRPDSDDLPPPRPQLILNLRTISQETGRTSGGLQSTFSPSPSSLSSQNIKVRPTSSPAVAQTEFHPDSRSELGEEETSEVIKRKGKLRKKKKKINLEIDKGEKEVVDLIEPRDTMVSTCNVNDIDWESDDYDDMGRRSAAKCASSNPTPPLMESDLFDNKTLKHLRRNLSISDIEAEFRKIWRRVLQEALGASGVLQSTKTKIDDDLKVHPTEPEKWLLYPRTFKHSNSRFDLPIDKKKLSNMRPLKYLKEYVSYSKSNLLLYTYVFNKYKDEDEQLLPRKEIKDALEQIMGQALNEEEIAEFIEIVDLKEDDKICLRTWFGLCAFSERLYGEKFSAGKLTDCGEREMLEILDFECLEKRKSKLDFNPKMLKLLNAIQVPKM